jgi:hypothetical protein
MDVVNLSASREIEQSVSVVRVSVSPVVRKDHSRMAVSIVVLATEGVSDPRRGRPPTMTKILSAGVVKPICC